MYKLGVSYGSWEGSHHSFFLICFNNSNNIFRILRIQDGHQYRAYLTKDHIGNGSTLFFSEHTNVNELLIKGKIDWIVL